MKVIVSDSSILLDIVKVELVEAALRLPYEIVVPQQLFESELISLGHYGRQDLLSLGIHIAEPDDTGYSLATEYVGRYRLLIENDCFALALAKVNNWLLLTGDRRLRLAANTEEVSVHGLLWLCDQMLEQQTVSTNELLEALMSFERDPLVWLPNNELRARIVRLRRVNRRL